eukprot:Pgem_evm1s18527
MVYVRGYILTNAEVALSLSSQKDGNKITDEYFMDEIVKLCISQQSSFCAMIIRPLSSEPKEPKD